MNGAGASFWDGISHPSELPYFHDDFTALKQVEDRLQQHHQKDGSFLVRPSLSRPNSYTITIVKNLMVYNIQIQQHSVSRQYFLKDHMFDSVQGLVTYYATTDVPNIERVEGIRLLHPIERRRQSLPASSAPQLPLTPTPRSSGFPLFRRNHRTSSSSSSELSGTIQGGALSGNSGGGSTSSLSASRDNSFHRPSNGALNNTTGQIDMRSRPPQPLPNSHPPLHPGDGYYSKPRDENVDLAPILIDNLRQMDNTVTCPCGIKMSDTYFIQGWSVHRSNEPPMQGRLYFMNDANQQSAWELPREVYAALTVEERCRLEELQRKYERRE